MCEIFLAFVEIMSAWACSDIAHPVKKMLCQGLVNIKWGMTNGLRT